MEENKNYIINENAIDKTRYGYMSISTSDQTMDKQGDALIKEGVYKIYQEKQSVKSLKRPVLTELINELKSDDTLYIHDLSRLAGSTKDLLITVKELQKKGVILKSIKEQIYLTNPMGNLIITLLEAINDFERVNRIETQKEAVASKKARGEYHQEIKYPENWDEVYAEYQRKNIELVEALERLGIKRSTFFKYVKLKGEPGKNKKRN